MDRPVAIEARGLYKTFHIPGERVSRRERLSGRDAGRELEVLRDISFDVHRGEFFGIVGRNGSGKSTLLKLLASVYKADAGRVRIAGRLAPFLELGIGFSPELTAVDNVVLNGVMMGLSPREARRRYDEIIEFAGLRDYTDLRIKNYSSGMKVRLGFAVMTHVDADVLLVDEVLAVGDADFQEKCIEAFERMHSNGRTIVLVTHNMPTVTDVCERALILHDGVIDMLGEADAVTQRYFEVNLSPDMIASDDVPEIGTSIFEAYMNPLSKITDARILNADGDPATELAGGEPIVVEATYTVKAELGTGSAYIRISSHDGRKVFASDRIPLDSGGAPSRALRVRVSIENPLPAGRYRIALDTLRDMEGEHPAGPTTGMWITINGERSSGTVLLDHEVTVSDAVEPAR